MNLVRAHDVLLKLIDKVKKLEIDKSIKSVLKYIDVLFICLIEPC